MWKVLRGRGGGDALYLRRRYYNGARYGKVLCQSTDGPSTLPVQKMNTTMAREVRVCSRLTSTEQSGKHMHFFAHYIWQYAPEQDR
jgi:hypothetical protein